MASLKKIEGFDALLKNGDELVDGESICCCYCLYFVNCDDDEDELFVIMSDFLAGILPGNVLVFDGVCYELISIYHCHGDEGISALPELALLDCFECGCCEFTPCPGQGIEEAHIVRCIGLPVDLEIGEVVDIGGVCYTYEGNVTCEGGEEEEAFGSEYATCEECLDCFDCTTAPDVIFATVGITAGGIGPCSCDNTDCAALSGTHTLTRVGTSCIWRSACIATCSKTGLSLPCTNPARWVHFEAEIIGGNKVRLSMNTFTDSSCTNAFLPPGRTAISDEVECISGSINTGAAIDDGGIFDGFGYCDMTSSSVTF